MLVDGRSVPDRDSIATDLCIIGCGPAGIAIARELAAPGLRVTVLEGGGLEHRRQADRRDAGTSVGYPYSIDGSRARGIGGTSLHWEMSSTGGDEGWIARPLDPIDFLPRPAIPGSGWPFRAADLEPYYQRGQDVSGLGRSGYEPADWPAEPSRAFDLGPDLVTHLVQRGSLRFSRYRDELSASPHIQLIHDATVTELIGEPGGSSVAQAAVSTEIGRRFTVGARRFVLATGGIENARLLLASRRDDGVAIGNEHNLVGRFFMERLSARAGVLVPAHPSLIPSAGLYRSHLVHGLRIQGVLSLAPDLVEREGLRNAAFWVRERPRWSAAPGVQSAVTLYRIARRRPLDVGPIPGHVMNVAHDLPDLVRAVSHHALRRPEPAHEVFQLGVQAEQAPNRDSRVTLGDGRDRFGRPLARLDWRPTEDDRASIQRSVELLDAAIRRAGLGRVIHKFGEERVPALFIGNWHHMGTTRMHPDPTEGVVDPSGRVHGMANLYVAGSSVFPTAGFANPTLTIVALALRLADELRAKPWGDANS